MLGDYNMLKVGDKVIVKHLNIKGIIILKERNGYHVKTDEYDDDLELPFRIFKESELEKR